VEFLGKNDFRNFFRGKFQFFPTFLWEKFSAEFSPKFSPKFSPEKMYDKSAPGQNSFEPSVPDDQTKEEKDLPRKLLSTLTKRGPIWPQTNLASNYYFFEFLMVDVNDWTLQRHLYGGII
jgi:hypothetical protein